MEWEFVVAALITGKPLSGADQLCNTASPGIEGQSWFRIGVACFVVLLAGSGGAMAETPAQRGGYLVNTIMACGNCHTPRDAEGQTLAGKALSGGLTFVTAGVHRHRAETSRRIATPELEAGATPRSGAR